MGLKEQDRRGNDALTLCHECNSLWMECERSRIVFCCVYKLNRSQVRQTAPTSFPHLLPRWPLTMPWCLLYVPAASRPLKSTLFEILSLHYNIIYMNTFDVDVICFIGFIHVFYFSTKEGHPYRKVILHFMKQRVSV